jgi:pSer/pThr/pTyr-binding forkhead associated (FHA) protein
MNVKLLVVQGRPVGKSLLFPSGDYYFGRGPECHVRPDSDWVSRQHCLLRVTADGVFLRDLGSRNGTLVNGMLVTADQRLAHGDQVQIGPLVFEVFLEPLSSPLQSTAFEAAPTQELTPAPGKEIDAERRTDEAINTQLLVPPQ